MRKYLAVFLVLASSSPVLADGNGHRHHRQDHRRYHNHYVPQHFYQRPPSAYLGLPAYGDRYYYSRPLPRGCWREQVGFDYWGRGIWETYC